MQRQARPLSGMELRDALVAIVEEKVGSEPAKLAERDLDNQWWTSFHLTFPRTVIEWCDSRCPDKGQGLWLRCVLGNGKEWEYRWNDEAADIRDLKKIGPFQTPDDLREALGLPRTAQFKLPDGTVVTAELPLAHLREAPFKAKEDVLDKLPEVPQLIRRPDSELEEALRIGKVSEESKQAFGLDVVRKEAGEAVDRLLASEEDLLAEPPKVDPTPPPPQPVAKPVKAGLRPKAAAKGGRK